MSPELFVSEKAKEMVEDLLKKAEQRNPDLHDLYIYNGGFAVTFSPTHPHDEWLP